MARWTAFVGASAVWLWPVLTTSIVADDFYVLFYQQTLGGDGFLRSLEIGMDGAALGHFNYVGQVIGAITAWGWIHLTFGAGVPFALVFGASKLAVYVATVTAAARLLRTVVEAGGGELDRWRARILVAVALFGTIQIHVPWSNDPVGSYPMSGFASAAVGVLLLSYAIEIYAAPTTWPVVALSLGGVASVLYYEINAAAVMGIAPIALWTLRRHWSDRGALDGVWWRRTGLLLAPVAVPALVTLAFRLASRPEAGGYEYSGTAVTVDGSILPSFGRALVSSLPGSAWKLSRDWLAAPVWIRPTPVLAIVALGTALALLRHRFGLGTRLRPGAAVVAATAAVFAYWTISTAIQVLTPKVRSESLGIGYVYNYYAVGSTAVAIMVAGGAVYVLPRVRPSVRVLVAPLAVALFSVQFLISWNVSSRFAEVTVPNRELLEAYADERPLAQRCDALRAWAGGAWPDYYERGVIDGIEDAWSEFRGGPFCGEDPSP